MLYSEQLLQPEWKEKSRHIFKLHDFTCERCGAENITLNAHRKYYTHGKMAWEYPDEAFECLCSHCHEVEHIPGCCDTPLFSLLYDKEARSKMLRPLKPYYCPICGTPTPGNF